MSVKIECLSSHSAALWTVRFGSRGVQFGNEKSAQDYAATLKARIEAPHVYPRRTSQVVGTQDGARGRTCSQKDR
ncbi:MAG TPA: hypothetical protein VJA19_11645 [Pseudomonas sp.]|nr:hypothetical protein [Pseudomonas sp.]